MNIIRDGVIFQK